MLTPLTPGQVLLGKYALGAILDEGPLGPTFMARDVRREQDVRVLVVSLDANEAREVSHRLRGRLGLELRGVASLLANERLADGRVALISEPAPGLSLRDAMALLPSTPESVWLALDTLASALGRLHLSGGVHRALRPAIVRLEPASTELTLVDAELVQLYAGPHLAPPPSSAGLGALIDPDFAAPEQLQPDAATLRATPSADVYAWGRLAAALRDHADLGRCWPPALDALVADATAHAPGARPADGFELQERLRALAPEDITLSPMSRNLYIVASRPMSSGAALDPQSTDADATAVQPPVDMTWPEVAVWDEGPTVIDDRPLEGNLHADSGALNDASSGRPLDADPSRPIAVYDDTSPERIGGGESPLAAISRSTVAAVVRATEQHRQASRRESPAPAIAKAATEPRPGDGSSRGSGAATASTSSRSGARRAGSADRPARRGEPPRPAPVAPHLRWALALGAALLGAALVYWWRI